MLHLFYFGEYEKWARYIFNIYKILYSITLINGIKSDSSISAPSFNLYFCTEIQYLITLLIPISILIINLVTHSYTQSSFENFKSIVNDQNDIQTFHFDILKLTFQVIILTTVNFEISKKKC